MSKESKVQEESEVPSNENGASSSIFSKYKETYKKRDPETMSVTEYLERGKSDPLVHANWAERLKHVIESKGVEIVDTALGNDREKRIHQSKKVAKYKAFEDFFGAENIIEEVMAHINESAQGGAKAKRILMMLGPPGGGKSSLSERLKDLMQEAPIYVLKAKGEKNDMFPLMSPINESPLGLFEDADMRSEVANAFGVAERKMSYGMSPWARKRLADADGDIDAAFEVVKVYPSKTNNIGISKVEAKDANNQDTGDLVGQVDMNKLGQGIDQNDTDCYLYDGGLCKGNQGIMEFVEMLKAPGSTHYPLLEATEGRQYKGNENIGVIPFDGLILAHTNENEWNKKSNDKTNEAIFNRMNVITVPYTLQQSAEANIYQKELDKTAYTDSPIAPKTVELLAEFSVMSRLAMTEALAQFDPDVRVRVLDGEIPDGATSKIPTIGDLRKYAPEEEGMSGSSVRFGIDTLSQTFNARANDGLTEADPILLFETLRKRIDNNKEYSAQEKGHFKQLLQEFIVPQYRDFISEEISMAYSDASDEMCQNMFDTYINMADSWLNEEEYNDQSVSGQILNRAEIERRLESFEKPAGIAGGKEFRSETVRYVHRKERNGEQVRWDSYEKLANVIRERLKANMKDFSAVVKFDVAKSDKQEKKFNQFLENMEEKGYTPTMVQRAVNFHNEYAMS